MDDVTEHGGACVLFRFAVILYDMWLLVDLLIQVNLDIEQ